MRRRSIPAVVTLLLLPGLLTGLLSPGVAAEPANAAPAADPTPVVPDSGEPVTVPSPQEWQPGGAPFVLGNGAVRVSVDPRHADALVADARTFAADLEARTGRRAVVVTGPPVTPGPGAIRLTLTPAADEHGPEASTIVVDRSVTISGPTTDGVFLGTRTLLQLLAQDRKIPGGTLTDWPVHEERSLMVDNGRKYFTPAWARRHIRELSYLKYNQFHWHITDNAGFRIESRRYPEVVSPEHWTQEQVKDLVAYAERYHVEVIPEIDMPGHMQYALRNHPEWRVERADGSRNANNLDPTNPEARAFALDLLDELIPLFSGRYVHTGGDEYTDTWDDYPVLEEWAQEKYGAEANAQDAVLDFTNELNALVRSHGKTMRIWNDGGQGGSVLEADRDIVLEYWSSQHGGVLAQEFLDRGFRLVNANRDFLYDVPGVTPTWNNLDPRKVAEQWDMTQWHDWIGPNTTAADHEGILGGQIHVWNDRPSAATEDQIGGRLAMPLRAMTEHLWAGERAVSEWDELSSRAFAVGHEPQWDTRPAAGGNLARDALTWSSARERPDCHESSLVDGDPATRWCGPKTAPQSVVVDLGRPVDLGRVVLRWEAAYAKGYRLDVSDDLAHWRSLASEASGNGGVDMVPVEGRGRYLRLSMDERGTSFGYSLFEIEAYAPEALVPADFTVALEPEVVLLRPDRPATARLVVSNASDRSAVVEWSTTAPEGVTVTPVSGTLRVPAGGASSVEVGLTASTVGEATVGISVTGSSLGSPVALADAELLLSTPRAAISDAFTNVGVTTDDDVDPPGLGAGFDGAGSSYSAEALAAEGITPGASLVVEGVPLTWPTSAPGAPNNVVANGQSVTLEGRASTLGVLTAATYGPASGDWVVHYADGSSDSVRLTTPDWTSTPPAGTVHVADMTYRNNTATGRTARRSQVFFQRIPVDPARDVVAVTLPTVGPEAVRGAPALHVFAVGLG